jgi:nitric-oxide synthase
VAGIDFVCCPFNGWFVDIEIARNFLERYNGADKIVPFFPALEKRQQEGDLSWREAVSMEVCRAVYHSFVKQGVTIVDRPTVWCVH